MPPEQVDKLDDPFAAAALRQGEFPLSLKEVLSLLDRAGSVPHQKSYMVSEAGQIPPTAAGLSERDLRFAIVRGEKDSQADLLISTGANGDPSVGFLQLAAWDTTQGLFNYYMRMEQTWVWTGDSYSALTPGSRGNGCFDSHVNGSVVMKELKSPWLNWQSMRATIILADDDPLRQNPLWQQLTGAEDLEIMITATVARWTAARLERAIAGGQVEHADWLLRQLCTTTTVNLASSEIESRVIVADPSTPLPLPLGLWFNNDALLDALQIPADFIRPVAAGQFYVDALSKYQFALKEGAFRQPGDSFFAFVIPEPALEDNNVIAQMVTLGLVNAHFAASVLMVDFTNPVFSAARTQLMAYVPQAVELDADRGGMSGAIADAISSAAPATPEGSPEREFAANWLMDDSQWPQVFAVRIQDYMSSVNSRISTAAGFDDYLGWPSPDAGSSGCGVSTSSPSRSPQPTSRRTHL